jgi:hypothetical protein
LPDSEELPQELGDGPATFRVWLADPEDALAKVQEATTGSGLRMVDGSALKLATILPTADRWLATLDVLQGIIPSMFHVQEFDGIRFSDAIFSSRSGFYQLWQADEGGAKKPERPKYTLFYDASRDVWVRGDWYGLRFLSHFINGETCLVRRESSSGRVAVPQDRRWPEIYERALVLASGRLPRYSGQWLVYEGIDERILNELAAKLNLECEETQLNA